MEDALRDASNIATESGMSVLILVLMEDALRGLYILATLHKSPSLNPCSNGRCSAREVKISEVSGDEGVLILVLMEDALRELNLKCVDCQLITVLFLENSLDFRGKCVPNRQQMYEISRCLHRATHYT